MRMVTRGLIAALACGVAGCSATIPPPVDVQGSAPLYIAPASTPPGTAPTVTVLPPPR